MAKVYYNREPFSTMYCSSKNHKKNVCATHYDANQLPLNLSR